MRPIFSAATAALLLGASACLATAPSAYAGDPGPRAAAPDQAGLPLLPLRTSAKVAHLSSHPSQVGIAGCFLPTAPLFVASGVESIRVYDVRDGTAPRLTGVLPSLQFENEAMNCGERVTSKGVRRFALVGLDPLYVNPFDIQHVSVSGNELLVVEVTRPSAPKVVSRIRSTTSTHTVACINRKRCDFVYSAGNDGKFSVFDLRNLARPREVDSNPRRAGVQPFASPTAGHKWNFDAAGIGTHTGFGGSSMWSLRDPARPRLITTTGVAGKGTDPRYPGWNDFIHHNSFRPNAHRFRPGARPSFANGNVLMVTEEDYVETDCAKAGSFQTWWVKRLDGTKNAIVPLDKVELADLGNYPLPNGAFCSAHWFDWHPTGIVAAGFYAGGTQLLDVRNPRDIKAYGHAWGGVSQVWDAMWLPRYDARGRQTGAKTNVVYSIDLVRGLDVLAVDVPGDGRGAVPPSGMTSSRSDSDLAAAAPAGIVGGAMLLAVAIQRARSRRTKTT
ncbi:hypothetical protein [Nocardioides speluncae]|uniref:hypothetical protein n=1 Tax=Nocardioides speluncae TaxID=2670337 RepID=UPI000D691809|nr:hypothetical protein [Nocardioides speluncae]